MILCGDGCDGCDGCDCVVDVVGEGDGPSGLLRAAITSPRKVLFFRRDSIFSAVSGLLVHDQPCLTRTIGHRRVYLVLPRFLPRLDLRG